MAIHACLFPFKYSRVARSITDISPYKELNQTFLSPMSKERNRNGNDIKKDSTPVAR